MINLMPSCLYTAATLCPEKKRCPAVLAFTKEFKNLSKVLRKIKYETENFAEEFSEKQLQVCPLWNYLFEED